MSDLCYLFQFCLNPQLFFLCFFLIPPLDITEALEMRENLQRQLQEIMSATKLTSGRRGSSRLARTGSGGQGSPHTPDSLGRMGRRSRNLEAIRYKSKTTQSTLFDPIGVSKLVASKRIQQSFQLFTRECRYRTCSCYCFLLHPVHLHQMLVPQDSLFAL